MHDIIIVAGAFVIASIGLLTMLAALSQPERRWPRH